jgi:iron complex outermembrane recepter protein
MKHVFTILLLLGLSVPGCLAAMATGVVVSTDGEPLAGVSLVTNEPSVGAISDTAGRFTLAYPEGVTRVTFSSVGYHSRQFVIGQVPDTVRLARMYYEGEPIVVQAHRAERGMSAMSFENVGRAEIQRDYTVGDLPLLLNTTPNLHAFSDGGGNLGYTYMKIRGFDDKRIASYINGVPLNDPEDQYTYWVDLPDFTSSVTDVQVQRGVGNTLYGHASFGGAINVVTNTLELGRQAELSSGYGEYFHDGRSVGRTLRQTVEYASGLIDGRWAFSGRFSKTASDGYRKGSWTEAWAYYLSLARLDPNMTTELHLFGGPARLHLSYLGVPRSILAEDRRFNPQTYEDETDNFNQPHYHLHNRYRLSERSTLANTLFLIKGQGWFEQNVEGAAYADYNVDTSLTGGAANGRIVRRQSVDKYQAGWNPRLDVEHDRGRHSVGGSFYFFESDHDGQVVWAEGVDAALRPGHTYYKYFGKKRVASVYAQEHYRLDDNLSFQATLQFKHQTYDFDQVPLGAFVGYDYRVSWNFLSPRLGVNYLLKDEPGRARANVYANFAVASRPPTDLSIYDPTTTGGVPSLEIESVSLDSTRWVFGDPTFRAERVYNLELGASYQTPRYTLSVNGYWMDFTDEIIPLGGVNPSTGIPATVNAEGSYRVGLELSGKANVTSGLTLSGNLALNRYRIKDFIDTLDVYDEAWSVVDQQVVRMEDKTGPAFPDYLANLVADYRWRGWRGTLRVQGVGKQYMELLNLDSLAIDPFAVVSVSAGYTLQGFAGLGDLSIAATVDNLFDRKYETSGYGWNVAYARENGPPLITGEAEYYVAAERSFWTELRLTLF